MPASRSSSSDRCLGAVSDTTSVLLLARILEGAGSGVAFALSRAIIRDTASRDQAASQIASVTMVMVVAPMLAPYLGGQIETLAGWRAIFWFMTGVGVIVLLLTLAKLPETAPNLGQRSSLLGVFSAFPTLIGDSSFVTNVIALAMTSAAFFSFIAAAPYVVVETMGRGPDVYGTYFIMTAFGYMVGNFLMSRIAVTFGTRRLVRIGLVISCTGMTIALGLALSPYWTPLTLFLPLVLNAIGNGMTIPGSTAAALSARPELAGSAAGLMGALQLGSGALGTVLIGWLVTLWAPSLVVLMWALTCIGLFALRFEGQKSSK